MRAHKGKATLLIGALLIGIFFWLKKPDTIGVAVNGVNHMRDGNSIGEYYIDGGAMGPIGAEGGGGRLICCVLLPEVWRPGLQVELRWAVVDHGIRKRVPYKAQVPVEKYTEPGELVVHFFRDRSARVVSSNYDVLSSSHPVAWSAVDGGAFATKGQRIAELFTSDELDQLERKYRK